MGHHLPAEAHRKALSENCMSEDWKDRDEVFDILRKDFILICFRAEEFPGKQRGHSYFNYLVPDHRLYCT